MGACSSSNAGSEPGSPSGGNQSGESAVLDPCQGDRQTIGARVPEDDLNAGSEPEVPSGGNQSGESAVLDPCQGDRQTIGASFPEDDFNEMDIFANACDLGIANDETSLFWIAERMCSEMPEGWSKLWNEGNHVVYRCDATGETQLEHPWIDLFREVVVLQRCAEHVLEQDEDAAASAANPYGLEAIWELLFDNYGNEFFYNAQSGEAQRTDTPIQRKQCLRQELLRRIHKRSQLQKLLQQEHAAKLKADLSNLMLRRMAEVICVVSFLRCSARATASNAEKPSLQTENVSTKELSPDVLIVQSLDGQQDSSGRYELQKEKANGMPVWRRAGSGEERWLYSGTRGKWQIGGADVQEMNFNCNSGFLCSMENHGGADPHTVTSWKYFDGVDDDGEKFRYSPGFQITAAEARSASPKAADKASAKAEPTASPSLDASPKGEPNTSPTENSTPTSPAGAPSPKAAGQTSDAADTMSNTSPKVKEEDSSSSSSDSDDEKADPCLQAAQKTVCDAAVGEQLTFHEVAVGTEQLALHDIAVGTDGEATARSASDPAVIAPLPVQSPPPRAEIATTRLQDPSGAALGTATPALRPHRADALDERGGSDSEELMRLDSTPGDRIAREDEWQTQHVSAFEIVAAGTPDQVKADMEAQRPDALPEQPCTSLCIHPKESVSQRSCAPGEPKRGMVALHDELLIMAAGRAVHRACSSACFSAFAQWRVHAVGAARAQVVRSTHAMATPAAEQETWLRPPLCTMSCSTSGFSACNASEEVPERGRSSHSPRTAVIEGLQRSPISSFVTQPISKACPARPLSPRRPSRGSAYGRGISKRVRAASSVHLSRGSGQSRDLAGRVSPEEISAADSCWQRQHFDHVAAALFCDPGLSAGEISLFAECFSKGQSLRAAPCLPLLPWGEEFQTPKRPSPLQKELRMEIAISATVQALSRLAQDVCFSAFARWWRCAQIDHVHMERKRSADTASGSRGENLLPCASCPAKESGNSRHFLRNNDRRSQGSQAFSFISKSSASPFFESRSDMTNPQSDAKSSKDAAEQCLHRKLPMDVREARLHIAQAEARMVRRLRYGQTPFTRTSQKHSLSARCKHEEAMMMAALVMLERQRAGSSFGSVPSQGADPASPPSPIARTVPEAPILKMERPAPGSAMEDSPTSRSSLAITMPDPASPGYSAPIEDFGLCSHGDFEASDDSRGSVLPGLSAGSRKAASACSEALVQARHQTAAGSATAAVRSASTSRLPVQRIAQDGNGLR